MLETFTLSSVWLSGGALAICGIAVAALMAHYHRQARTRRKRLAQYERLQRI